MSVVRLRSGHNFAGCRFSVVSRHLFSYRSWFALASRQVSKLCRLSLLCLRWPLNQYPFLVLAEDCSPEECPEFESMSLIHLRKYYLGFKV